MRYLKLFFLLLIAVAFVIFAVVNREAISISLWPLPYSAELPKFLMAILCFALGAMVGWLTLGLRYSRNKSLLRAERKRVGALQDEIKALKSEQFSLPAIDKKP